MDLANLPPGLPPLPPGRPPLPPGRPPQPQVIYQAPSSASEKPALKAAKSRKAGALESLQSAYDASSSDNDDADAPAKSVEAPPRKKQKAASASTEAAGSNTLSWPIEWAWLLHRTLGHADFRAPPRTDCTAAADGDGDTGPRQRIIAVATSLVYVGDTSHGFDPRHLGRVVAVGEDGNTLLDAYVRPRGPLLDSRAAFTGVTEKALKGATAFDFETVRSKFLELLRPDTLVVGYRISGDLEAMHIWHGPLVDVSLLFGVDSRKQHQYHTLRYAAAHLLGANTRDDDVQDALENARFTLQLAQFEAGQPVPTPAFPPREPDPRELVVRHIPRGWGAAAASKLLELCPGARQDVKVRWLLSDADPTEWRGQATLCFPDVTACDGAFARLQGLADVHVQWQDVPEAPPLGSFISEHALVKAFSPFGMVVCARIPRKGTTREPQPFAFVSFHSLEDAQRAGRTQEVDLQITPSWTVTLRPRLAKYGHAFDKRVGVHVGGEAGMDYVHVTRR
eukprot:TRINITY_DN57579_c0_g1_i1.p1 TRINITY_DN57579_c0_g1~~TRINITY_DN57579_c0_g1_i1.p1  ORF type:complete len:536 (-),score=65.33 TRINITY_DN57579_c0_g1_i1:171-1694(-)